MRHAFFSQFPRRYSKLKYGILGSLSLVLLLTGTAEARKVVVHSTSDPVMLALTLAEQYWNATPCHGNISVLAVPPVMSDASMWTYGVMTPGESAALASCSIYVSNQLWYGWFVDDLNFESFCKSIVHEVGHYEGHPDEGAQPGTVEAASPQFATVLPCEHYRLRYGHRVFS